MTCAVNVKYVFDLEDLVQKSVTFSLIFLRFIQVELTNKTVKMYNPINYVNKDIPNTLIIHGKADELVPYESSVMLYDKCKKENAKSDLILLDFSSHDFSGISEDDILNFSTGLLKFVVLNSPL